MNTEKYIAFKKRLGFISIYTIDRKQIELQIYRNVFYIQPYSIECHDFIKKTCLQIFPKVENPLRIFSKLYNKIKIQNPIKKSL